MASGNAYFAGTIYATAGDIGGWRITDKELYRTASVTRTIDGKSITRTEYTALRAPDEATGGTTAIAIGSTSLSSFDDAVFKVDYAGNMKATAGTIGA